MNRPVAEGLPKTIGPNRWEEITPEEFGPEQDFDLEDHDTFWVVTPVSEAALQWLYYHLPEDAPRWNAKGFKVEADYITLLVARMRQDKLMSRQDYENSMNEADAQQHQERR